MRNELRMSYEQQEPIKVTVAELKPRLKSITISFKVIEIGEEREVTSRRDDTTHTVVDVVVGDSTGIVRMPLWDAAIEMVEKEKTYVLTNGYTGLFRNTLQLSVGRYGNLAESEDAIEEVNMSLDMSVEEHEDTRYRKDRDQGGRTHRSQSHSYDNRGRRTY